MEDYKANSHKSKAEQANLLAEKKKIDPVVKGTVKKKKNGVRKLTDSFVSEDIRNVKSYIVMDVLIPAAKKAISDMVTNGIDMILYGENGKTKTSRNSDYVSYNRYYDRRDDDRRYSGTRARSMFDYDDLVFETRGEAESVLNGMDDILDTYQVVSVLDFYDLAGVDNDNSQSQKYGWTNIRSARVERVRDGYVIRMPRALPID